MAYIGKQPAPAALTSSDITDGIVTTAKIADGTIATADIADGAVTSVKTTGVGGLTLLNSASSSVDVAQVDIDSTYINSTYDNYLIKFNAIPATGAVNFFSRFFVGGTIQTGSNYAYELYNLGSGSGNGGNNGDTGIPFNNIDTIGNSSTDTIQVTMELGNVNNTTYQTSLFFQSHLMNNDATAIPYSFTGVGHYKTNSSVVNGIRFYFSSGNVSDYEYKIYGITKS